MQGQALGRRKSSPGQVEHFSDAVTGKILLQERNMTGNKDENMRGVAGEGSKPV